tara:strand:+ start:220 stop:597 length:378 start_codon:yes stop_codon:yes gene_type:complete
MLKYIIVISLLIGPVGFSQNIIHTETYDNSSNVKSLSYYKINENSIERIKKETFYFNGQKQELMTYKDGYKNGKWVQWDESGIKRGEGNYKDGERDGKWYEWNSNGKKKRDGIFKNGKMISEKKY